MYEKEEEIAGLPIIPPADQELRKELRDAGDSLMACCNCGFVQELKVQDEPCDACGDRDWSKAYPAN